MNVTSLHKNRPATNWDEKYLTQVGYFSHVNAG